MRGFCFEVIYKKRPAVSEHGRPELRLRRQTSRTEKIFTGRTAEIFKAALKRWVELELDSPGSIIMVEDLV
jgi:hypothetical protein